MKQQQVLQYESMEFEPFHSRQTLEYFKKESHDRIDISSKSKAFMRWVWSFWIGLFTAATAWLIGRGFECISEWKLQRLLNLIDAEKNEAVMIGLSALGYVGMNAGCAIVGALVVGVEPAAAGSGIPEIKAFLNGVRVRSWLSMPTLCCKVIGVIFSVSAGLPVGKEGPMIHSGAIIASQIANHKWVRWIQAKVLLLNPGRRGRLI